MTSAASKKIGAKLKKILNPEITTLVSSKSPPPHDHFASHKVVVKVMDVDVVVNVVVVVVVVVVIAASLENRKL